MQLYMAWLQLIQMTNLNSLIMAHQGGATDVILDMFVRMANKYPDWLLSDEDNDISQEEEPANERRYRKKGQNKMFASGRSRSA